MRIRFVDIMFWAFLIITGILVLWRVFGNSPGVDAILGSVVVGIIFMMIGQGERLTKLEMGTRYGFVVMKKDMDLIKGDMQLIKERLGV
jgi:hypothetical protein